MKAKDLATEKLKALQVVMEIDNPQVLHDIAAVYGKTGVKRLSVEEYNDELEKSEKQGKKGHTITLDELKAKTEKWEKAKGLK